MPTATTTIGDEDTAARIATLHHGGLDDLDAIGYIGHGSHRTAYADYNTDTVYKVGIDRANREEHRVLTAARAAGADWAPATTLYDVTIDGMYGPVTCTVIAMPYLPEDGSVEHAGHVIPASGDLNPDNIHAHGGNLWLIDAGGC